MSEGPFHGIRILDLSTVIAGPMATAILADQGAEVIKIEEPGLGDRGRHVGTQKNGMSAFFMMANRGKKSIALNLKDTADADVLRALIATADVVFHNSRPGAMERLGFGYDAVRALRDDIVYVSISGFGDAGPKAAHGAYDQVLQCFSGMADVQRNAAGEPVLVRTVLMDKICALYAAQAISAALYARQGGRGGQQVRLSMVAAAAAFLWIDTAKGEALLDDDVVPAPSAAERCKLFRFADGWGTIAPATDRSYVEMLRAFGVPMADDPRLATYLARMRHPEANAEAMRAWAAIAATLPTAEVIARLEAVDVPCAPVNSLEAFAAHPQTVAAGVFRETVHPLAGRVREPNPAATFSATPARIGAPAPALDGDRAEILESADVKSGGENQHGGGV